MTESERTRGRRRLADVATRLSAISRENRYDVYTVFDWPAALDTDQYWISPQLMTCYGTAQWDHLTEQQRVVLSHYEAVGFFSLNVHLIRELIGAVVDRIYTSRYPELSEFFHDFIAEENVHAWFFATFCRRYGGKVYPPKHVDLGAPADQDVLRDIEVFGRILIAEELCDFFNTTMAHDERLPQICRDINRVHHEDEARHIAFGRQIMRALRDEVAEHAGPERLAEVGQYLGRYIGLCLRTFYNREIYADAGLADPGRIRSQLVTDPSRIAAHRMAAGRTVAFLERTGVLSDDDVHW
jgi:P-aminobenzoate N-oxygenase AurF